MYVTRLRAVVAARQRWRGGPRLMGHNGGGPRLMGGPKGRLCPRQRGGRVCPRQLCPGRAEPASPRGRELRCQVPRQNLVPRQGPSSTCMFPPGHSALAAAD